MRAAAAGEADVQGLCLRCAGFQREDEGVGQEKAGGIDLAGGFMAVGGFRVEACERRAILPRMGSEQFLVQRFHRWLPAIGGRGRRGCSFHVLATGRPSLRPFSIWLATQRWKFRTGPSIAGEKRPPSNRKIGRAAWREGGYSESGRGA